MLWARFEPTADGLRTAVHVSGAERGDLVMVTGEAVIAEIAARHLTFGQAYARGVARLYGDDAQIAAFARNYRPGRRKSERLTPLRERTLMPDSLDAEAHAFDCRPRSSTGGRVQTSDKLIQ